MKLLRWLLVILVVLYAGWIAWPVVKTFLFPSAPVPVTGMRTMDESDYQGGFNGPMTSEDTALMTESIQGDTAVQAIATQNTPVVLLWSAVILFYLVAAWLHANGNLRAAFVYLLGLVADFVLTYLTNGNKYGGIWDKILSILSGWDPRYVLTLVAMLLGFLVYMSRRRIDTVRVRAVPDED